MTRFWIFGAVLLAATACGGSEQAKNDQPAAGAPASATGRVVPFEQLQALLPDLPGWTRGDPRGETVTEGTRISRVQVDYNKGDGTLSFELMDTAGDEPLLAELRPLIKSGYSEERDGGYNKATTVKGFPATEEWTKEARNGYISVLVAERFVLKVTGGYVPDVETIRQAVEAFDLQKLAALKN